MKFLANENFPFPSIVILRNNGFDVLSIQDNHNGISDEEVIKMAVKEDRIILTFDRDYGELIFKYGLQKPPTVVYFREKGSNPSAAGNRLLQIIENNKINILNTFTVIEDDNIRQRNYKQ